MIHLIFASLFAFVATNIDDIFVLTALFGLSQNRKERTNILVGQCIGLLLTFLIASFGAVAVSSLNKEYAYLLGIIPLVMGIREVVVSQKEKEKVYSSLNIFSVVAIALSDGGDNIGVYLPLLSDYSFVEILLTGIVFLVLMIGTCHIAKRISELLFIEKFLTRYRGIVVPSILILLGIFVILGGIIQ